MKRDPSGPLRHFRFSDFGLHGGRLRANESRRERELPQHEGTSDGETQDLGHQFTICGSSENPSKATSGPPSDLHFTAQHSKCSQGTPVEGRDSILHPHVTRGQMVACEICTVRIRYSSTLNFDIRPSIQQSLHPGVHTIVDQRRI